MPALEYHLLDARGLRLASQQYTAPASISTWAVFYVLDDTRAGYRNKNRCPSAPVIKFSLKLYLLQRSQCGISQNHESADQILN